MSGRLNSNQGPLFSSCRRDERVPADLLVRDVAAFLDPSRPELADDLWGRERRAFGCRARITRRSKRSGRWSIGERARCCHVCYHFAKVGLPARRLMRQETAHGAEAEQIAGHAAPDPFRQAAVTISAGHGPSATRCPLAIPLAGSHRRHRVDCRCRRAGHAGFNSP